MPGNAPGTWVRTCAGPSIRPQPPGGNRAGGWSRRGDGILDHLQVHGVPVDRSLTRLSWGAHLDHP